MSTPPPLGMSAPPPPPPPPPPSGSRKGCFIAIGVTLVVILLICLGVCIVGARNPGRMVAFGVKSARTQVMAFIASDVSAEQRAEFEAEYDAYQAWLEATPPEDLKAQGEAFVAPFQQLQAAQADKTLTADEMQRFVEVSRNLRGVAAPEPPAPAPTAPAAPVQDAPPPTTAPDGATAPIEGAPPEPTAPEGATSPDGTPVPAPGTP